MDSKELTIIVILDFSKAFDSIDHCKLLVKLQHWVSVLAPWNGSEVISLIENSK